MDKDDARIPGSPDDKTISKMTLSSVRNNGPRVAVAVTVKRETAGEGEKSVSATPNGSKDDSLSPSMSPDVKMTSSDSASTPETGPVPKTTTTTTTRKPTAAAKTAASTPNRVLFDHLPDATDEAKSQFQVITDCLYGSKHMGSSDHDALECDCAAEWQDGQNMACGEDSDCINRATKIECVRGDCNCGESCQNQRFQRKQYAQVSVIKTDKKGFGLRADVELHAHDFIYEYIGEVINEPAFRRRMLQYDEEGIKHFYFMSLTKNEFVDATRKGNLGRFCNHSCNPNCYVDKWVVGEKLRMGIFAGRNIQAGEELVFDYNVDRYGAEPQPCYCGEPNCSGYIGGKTQTERATKLPQATIEALGLEDLDGWGDVAATRKTTPTGTASAKRKKRPNDDEEYVNSLEPTGLVEDGVTKVMAALMQCKERWIAVKLLARIQAAALRDDERVLNRVVRMHGYQILSALVTAFQSDDNVVLQVLDILDRLPRLTKNKIADSNIESVIEGLVAGATNEKVTAQSRHLLDAWSKLETGYRIPRKKQTDHATPTTSSYEDDRRRGDAAASTATKEDDVASNGSGPAGRSRAQQQQQQDPLSPFHGKVIPKGPRSNIPQRHMPFFNGGGNSTPRNRRGPDGGLSNGLLPAGWFEAKDPNGTTYYYAPGRAATWKRPTQPADKVPTKAQQKSNAVQEIINSIVKEETPRPSANRTPQAAARSTPVAEPKQERWRTYPIEKQMRVYENTLFPHIKSVTDQYRRRLPKEELKKLAKDLSKKLVASDYKNNRVEDPTTITPRVEKKVKAYVKDFFERAVVKYEEHAKRKAEREAGQHPHKTAAVSTDEDGDVTMADVGDEQSDGEHDDHFDHDEHSDHSDHSPESAGRKRKRTVSDALRVHADLLHADVPSPGQALSEMLSETPLLKKRLREDEGTTTTTTTTTTPTTTTTAIVPAENGCAPPPPPPPPEDEQDEAEEERRQLREQEEELMRENEEAMRAFEEANDKKEHSAGIHGVPPPALNGPRPTEMVGH